MQNPGGRAESQRAWPSDPGVVGDDTTGQGGGRGDRDRGGQADRGVWGEHRHHPHRDVVLLGGHLDSRAGPVIPWWPHDSDLRNRVSDRFPGAAQPHPQRRLAAQFDQQRQLLGDTCVVLGAGQSEIGGAEQRRRCSDADQRPAIVAPTHGDRVGHRPGG